MQTPPYPFADVASNKILKLMNRKYTFDQFLSKITYIKSISPDVTIGSDVITGFPGETDDDLTKHTPTSSMLLSTISMYSPIQQEKEQKLKL